MSDKNPKVATDARTMGVYEADATVGTFQVWTPIRVSQNGILLSTFTSETGESILLFPGVDLDATTLALPTAGMNYLWDESAFTWNPQHNNEELTLLASAARTADVNSADFTNYNAKGLHVILNVSALAATPSIVPFIQGKDPISGTYYDILEGLPITTTGINIIKVYPGISAVVNVSASDLLPRTYRVRVEHGDADSITYSVAGALVL